jgi:hypothetical protein
MKEQSLTAKRVPEAGADRAERLLAGGERLVAVLGGLRGVVDRLLLHVPGGALGGRLRGAGGARGGLLRGLGDLGRRGRGGEAAGRDGARGARSAQSRRGRRAEGGHGRRAECFRGRGGRR